jgi:hypothetical protein
MAFTSPNSANIASNEQQRTATRRNGAERPHAC